MLINCPDNSNIIAIRTNLSSCGGLSLISDIVILNVQISARTGHPLSLARTVK